MNFTVRQLLPADLALYDGMLSLFSEAFEDAASYDHDRPGPAWRERLLASDHFIALAALSPPHDAVVGALAAYVLDKFEQERARSTSTISRSPPTIDAAASPRP